jgi:hypothetical protein
VTKRIGVLVILLGILGVALGGLAQPATDGSVLYPASQEDLELQPEAWPFYYCTTELEWVEQLTGWEIADTIDISCQYKSSAACWLFYGEYSECYKYRRKSLWLVNEYEVCYVLGIPVSRHLVAQHEYYKYKNDTFWTCPGYFPFCC